MDHFTNATASYVRDYDLVTTYVEDSATYLSLQTGQPIEKCREFVSKQIADGGQYALKIPRAMVLAKNKVGDREIKTVPLDRFLERCRDHKLILSPSMAAYAPSAKKRSLLAKYINGNLDKRKKAKKAMFEAKVAGDVRAASNLNDLQSTFKIKNNALSGAQCSPFTILWNKSAHSTLTSTCRTATSYANANNEKLLYGNRHYWSADITKANIISLVNHTDLEHLARMLQTYQLRMPTFEETMKAVHRSTDPYWRSPRFMAPIEKMVAALSDIQRAAFMYIGDFYHLAQCNGDFVRKFLGTLSKKATVPLEDSDEIEKWMKSMDSNLTAFVSILCAKELDGSTIADAKEKRPRDYALLAATAKKILLSLDEYGDLLHTLFVTKNLPSSIFSLPSIIRRGVITSDTDSTIFSTDYWTTWYMGKLDFSEESIAIANTMVYLSAQSVRHILATMSGNMGVEQEHVRRLSMKNEYYFPVFTLTSRAKHYFAYIAAQEGNVFKEMETEVKGVALRNSNIPATIMKQAKSLMLSFMDSVMREEKISIISILRTVAKLENTILKSVEAGKYEYLSRVRINARDAYKKPESSNYVHHELWEAVFADKYGHVAEPPYTAIKMSVQADNPTKLKEWIDAIVDRSVADRLIAFMAERGRKGISTMYLPEPILAMKGVPVEVIPVIDVRALIFQLMEVYYLVLESVGIFMRNKNVTRLISDNQWLVVTDEDIKAAEDTCEEVNPEDMVSLRDAVEISEESDDI